MGWFLTVSVIGEVNHEVSSTQTGNTGLPIHAASCRQRAISYLTDNRRCFFNFKI
jgi:hypothetical protein